MEMHAIRIDHIVPYAYEEKDGKKYRYEYPYEFSVSHLKAKIYEFTDPIQVQYCINRYDDQQYQVIPPGLEMLNYIICILYQEN